MVRQTTIRIAGLRPFNSGNLKKTCLNKLRIFLKFSVKPAFVVKLGNHMSWNNHGFSCNKFLNS